VKTILILDDDSHSINVLQWVLERKYRILTAETADAAISLFHQHKAHVSLIISDVVLRSPLSGTEVGLRVRESYPDLPILFTSGTPLEGWKDADFTNLKALGSYYDFLQKPFTVGTLVSKVDNLLNGASAAADMQALLEHAETYRRGPKWSPCVRYQ
jgi:DNA-binding NtrC family response regulator